MTTSAPTRCGVIGVFLALAGVSLLFACETSDTSDPSGSTDTDAASNTDGSGPDASTDANDTNDASDADDDFVVPDASVVCDADPCAVSITGYGDSFCIVLQNGKVSCWGSNTSGQLGYEVDGGAFSATPHVLSNLANVTSASVSDANGCARVGSGEVFCWGAASLINAGIAPSDGGEAASDPVLRPMRMSAVPAVTNVAVGKGFACASTSDGSLSCWGTNAKRELGRGKGTATDFIEPPAKALLLTEKVATVAPGVQRTFAITPNGDVFSWGAGSLYGPDDFNRITNLVDYLLGRDISEEVDGIPTVALRLARVRGLQTSSTHGCAVTGRDVFCWGTNALGQLGRGSYNPSPSVFQLPPSFLPDISNVRFVADAEKLEAGAQEKDVPIQVAVADDHSCVVMGSGRVYCWGKKGNVGVLGANATEDIVGTPTRVGGLSGPAVGIASAASSVCALLRSGAVECWGANAQGQLGTGTADELPHPAPARVLLAN